MLSQTARGTNGRAVRLASLASCITAATLGALSWLLVNELHLVPSFPELAETAQRVGLWTFSASVASA